MIVKNISIGKPLDSSLIIKQLQRACEKEKFTSERYSIVAGGDTYLFNNTVVQTDSEKIKNLILVTKRISPNVAMHNDGVYSEYFLIKTHELRKERDRAGNTLAKIFESESKYSFTNKDPRNLTSRNIYI